MCMSHAYMAPVSAPFKAFGRLHLAAVQWELMTTVAKNDIRRKVLEYVTNNRAPVHIRTLAENIRKSNIKLRTVDDSDFRTVVQPMIVTGKLNYAPGLMIKLGEKTK